MLKSPPLESHSMPHQPADAPINPSELLSQQPTPPVKGTTRSAIACARCRHSKTKCINNSDQKTPCTACLKSNKLCEWNHDKTTPSLKTDPSRRNSSVADLTDGGVGKKRRKDKILAPFASTNVTDALNPEILTPQVWKELFAIYEKHFATDFPFIHRARFLEPLNVASTDPSSTSTPIRPRYSKPFLLAFLTQTSRFHAGLISQVSKRTGLQTAEAYATAARHEMGPDFAAKIYSLAEPCEEALHGIQALLMLGFHEYNMWGREAGWLNIHSATALIHALQYVDDEKREEKLNPERRGPPATDDLSASNRFVDREIERRTVWCCFILDRYLCADRDYPGFLQGKRLGRKVQLPCSDKAFNNGRSRHTRKLGENNEQYAARRAYLRGKAQQSRKQPFVSYDESEWEVGEQEGELSLYLQIVDVYGDVIQWSCDDGRRKEIHPPWHPACEFKPLEDRLDELHSQLPRDFQLTPLNTRNHYYSNTPRHYVSIHAVYMLSTINLYREYMAFTPFRIEKPSGPLDEPIIEEEPLEPDYWVKQAAKCFGSARDFADLLKACPRQTKEQHELMVETPMVCWSIYQIAWFGLYCRFFPQMDVGNSLGPDANMWSFMNELMTSMTSRWKKPSDYGWALQRLHKKFQKAKAKEKASRGSPNSTTSDSGGGLEDFSAFYERTQKDFGSMGLGRRLESKEKMKTERDTSSPPTHLKTEADLHSSFNATSPDAPTSFTSINGSKSRTATPISNQAHGVPPTNSPVASHRAHANENTPGVGYNHGSTMYSQNIAYNRPNVEGTYPMGTNLSSHLGTTPYNSSSGWTTHQPQSDGSGPVDHIPDDFRSDIPGMYFDLDVGNIFQPIDSNYVEGYWDQNGVYNPETVQYGGGVPQGQQIYSPVQDQQSYSHFPQYSNN